MFSTFDLRLLLYVIRLAGWLKHCNLSLSNTLQMVALTMVANVVPELPLADLGISMAARKALRSVIAWWLIEAQAASEGRQI